MSESGAGDTSSDNNDVNVAVATRGSAFSGGGGDIFRAASGIGLRRMATVLPRESEIAKRDEAEHGAYDPSEHVGVHHCDEPLGYDDDVEVFSLSLSLSLFLFLALVSLSAWLATTRIWI